jgi:hypothetical protein
MVVVGEFQRGLASALLQNLAAEIPAIEFALGERADLDSIWFCGYEPRHAHELARLRARHPLATIVATRRGPLQSWADEARRAGADVASSWPVDFEELGALLLSRVAPRGSDR